MKDHYYIEPKILSNTFEALSVNNHEKLIFGYDKKSGMKIILAIHDTTLGPSTGGTRLALVSEEKAIEEALRLSYAMTFKTAIIDEPFGGSKAVIVGDPSKPKSKEFLHAVGDFIESLGGAFLTGVDMGLTVEDAKVISERTQYIYNSKGISGVTTAYGVLKGIRETVHYKLGKDNLKGVRVAVQGLGNVGGTLTNLLLKEGAYVFVSDIDPKKVDQYLNKENVSVVDNEFIIETECDVFAPCAIGEILNEQTIPRLRCKIVAGGANNQLQNEEKHANDLLTKGILHAPDFVINAGGVCHGMCEVKGVDVSEAMKKTDLIPGILREVFERSDKEKRPPMSVAYHIAYEKIQAKKR